jgi:hypothetical protein
VPLRPDHSAGDNVENKVETRRIEVAPVHLLQAGNRRKIVVPSVLLGYLQSQIEEMGCY